MFELPTNPRKEENIMNKNLVSIRLIQTSDIVGAMIKI